MEEDTDQEGKAKQKEGTGLKMNAED